MRRLLFLLFNVMFFISPSLLYGQDNTDDKDTTKISGVVSDSTKCRGCEPAAITTPKAPNLGNVVMVPVPAVPLSAPGISHLIQSPEDNKTLANISARLDSMKKTVDAQTRVINELNQRIAKIESKEQK
ncbi:hypothetical protein AB8989_15480 [Yersinia hibernica]|uniref:Secreted protein n=1 Tax=Yersinia hibernica TaxID=2339259 RepID=A0ABX5R289_9GAMM|nr:hypothetical protein [Yersinia hibernica]QAX79742.1 hypothetical protein D5F51_14970 [Yersinia hibernica]